MVADDSPSLRTLLTTLLSLEPGFEVAGVAADGAEAVETVLRVRPDLLLLDLAMPRVDGLQVIEQLKDRCLSFGSSSSPGTRPPRARAGQARDRGAAAYVRKGRPPEDLIEALRLRRLMPGWPELFTPAPLARSESAGRVGPFALILVLAFLLAPIGDVGESGRATVAPPCSCS